MDAQAHDKAYGGYYESFKEDWKPELKEYPIGPADKKSYNTHLHLLESITALARVSGDKTAHSRVEELYNLFLHKMADPAGYTPQYFEPDWRPVKGDAS